MRETTSESALQAAPIPQGWAAMLDSIDARLREAVAAVDGQAAGMTMSAADSASVALKREWADLANRLRDLQERVTRAQAMADDEDMSFVVDEDALRRQLAGTQSLRQRLAAWAGRAIG